jgi:hypothetical protein
MALLVFTFDISLRIIFNLSIISTPSILIIKMSGLEIIERLKKIKTQISDKDAIQRIDYLIDDIFMYKNNSL